VVDERVRTRSRLIAAAAIFAGFALFSAPAAAFAEDPVDLQGEHIIDTVGALDGNQAEVEGSLEALYNGTSVQLYVVFVDSFTGADNREDWVVQTAELNDLGDNNVLVAVAVDDSLYQLWQADNLELSDDEVSAVATDYLVPDLREANWADAAMNFASGLDDALMDYEEVTNPGDEDYYEDPDFGLPEDSTTTAVNTMFTIVPILFVLFIIGIVISVIYRASRSKNPVAAPAGASTFRSPPPPPGPPAPPPGPTQAQLDARAGSLLVQLDDALTTSEQELGFANAQFGDEATAEFQTALTGAKSKIAKAFGLRQKLDDSVPDTADEKRAWTIEIIELCQSAEAQLDAQSDAFDKLSELERNAPTVITAVERDLPTLRSALSSAKSTTAALAQRYSAAAIAPIEGNAEQASGLIDLAALNITEARSAIAAGKNGEAAVDVRTAQAAASQARQVLDAVIALETALADAAARLDAEVAETRQDTVEARAAGLPELEPTIAATEAALDYALTAGSKDPVGSLARVEKQSGALNAALTGRREKDAQVQRAAALLPGSIQTAHTQLTTGEQYLASRRGGVGTDARTRLASARQHLDAARALASTDPIAALAEAEQASSLAEAGAKLAQTDVDDFTSGGGGFGGGGNNTGAIVGGILAGLLLGGVNGGGNRGGGLFGGDRDDDNDSFFGGGSSGSSFGGFGGFGGGGGGHSGGGGSFGGGGGGGGHAGGGGGF
jgi:uncharacterized membrane protein YgcG